MIPFNQIQDEAQKDLKFDISTVEHYALQIVMLKEKYARYLQAYRMELKKRLFEQDKVYADRHDYHMTQNPRARDRRDVDIFIKADPAYRKVSAETYIVEEQVRYIDSLIKSIDNMSFNINSAIKLHIFKNGG